MRRDGALVTVLRVAARTQYFFDNLGGSQTETVVLAQHVDTRFCAQIDVELRLHGATSIGAGATLTLAVVADGYDAGDPSTVFLTTLASVTFNSTATFPLVSVLSSASFGGFGRYVALQLQASQPASPVTLRAEVSADLVLAGVEVPEEIAFNPNQALGDVLQ